MAEAAVNGAFLRGATGACGGMGRAAEKRRRGARGGGQVVRTRTVAQRRLQCAARHPIRAALRGPGAAAAVGRGGARAASGLAQHRQRRLHGGGLGQDRNNGCGTPEHHQEHQEIFGAPVQFGRRTNALAFRPVDLDTRMPAADPYLYSIVERFLRSRCELHEDPENFAESVRNQIKLNLSTTIPTIAEIAQLFGLSDQKFQHELHAHKLSFKSLLKAAREELSLHYLDNHDLPLTEVAILLGYSELSAFSRAFRNWTGMSPQRYRQSHRRSPKPHTI